MMLHMYIYILYMLQKLDKLMNKWVVIRKMS